MFLTAHYCEACGKLSLAPIRPNHFAPGAVSVCGGEVREVLFREMPTAPVAFGDARMPERFWSKIERGAEEDCWVWTGRLDSEGYGIWQWVEDGHRRTRTVHRAAYIELVVPVEPHLVIDHLCRNRACVNPAHLEPVTQAENLRRSPKRNRDFISHCPLGHAYDDANTYVRADGRYACRACAAERARRRKVAA